ncbi:DUF2617 domain-containing protein [Nocardiopsis gilva YIM 90087]|uniref:DUF2617 domain-containing protein n=1 Tax=Nocardiopsis gilva YIM 90087 TaxID=1235441 RepID=A0A223S2P1_9ACTN|nr:DUF2617 family protein [Nocardiopsis gilva]ASU82395.1 DUF2617 domain-containing protein [Nocardiopsis gilva YIM 90087]
MHTLVSAPFVDTRAADLAWSLRHPLIEPLAVRTVPTPQGSVELRVLGASHQVRVTAWDGDDGTIVGDDAGGELLETVACLPDQEGALPERTTAAGPGAARYTFDSVVESFPGDDQEFAARVTHLRDEARARPDALIGTFPGSPLAVTALALLDPGTPGGSALTWRTWHAYPQSAELVTTTTSVVFPSADIPRI